MLMNTSNRNHKTYNSSRPLKNVFPYNFFKKYIKKIKHMFNAHTRELKSEDLTEVFNDIAANLDFVNSLYD